MKLVIDAYNVLKNIRHHETCSSDQINWFYNQLARYAAMKQLELIVIFDGGASSYQERFFIKQIEIIYVGKNRTADDFIKQYLDAYYTSDLLLVSSDRELILYAQKYGLCSIEAVLFWHLLMQALEKIPIKKSKQHSSMIKVSETNNEELDSLMAEVSDKDIAFKQDVVSLYNEDDKAHGRSKIDKKLLMKMKKL